MDLGGTKGITFVQRELVINYNSNMIIVPVRPSSSYRVALFTRAPHDGYTGLCRASVLADL